MKTQYDIIIVGAGPAGSVLAYQLAKLGLQVLIIEKAHLPRYKTCGGGLTFKARQNLPFDVAPVIELEAAGGIFSYAGRYTGVIDTQRPLAWLVMRDRFDHFLVQQAVQAGAVLWDGLAVNDFEQQDGLVRIHTPRAKISGRVLVGADGVNSLVARSAGLLPQREVGFAIEAELAVPASALDQQGPYVTFDFGALPRGYGWIFPKSDHLSVGVFHARPGKAVGLRGYLDSFIASQPVLAENEALSTRGHPIPLGGKQALLHKGRLLLVGDAANLADPWLGEGLYYAILSAKIAAAVIWEAFESGSLDLSDYTTRINDRIIEQLFQARIFAWLVYRLPSLGIMLMAKSEYLQAAVLDVIRGDSTFQHLNNRLLRGLPRILAQAARTLN